MTSIGTRCLADRQFELSDGLVHVWLVSLAPPNLILDSFVGFLSPDEKSRACQFRNGSLRDAFILVRGTLRKLLGRYLDIQPAKVDFVYGPNGKPQLGIHERLRFNVSHSDSLAAFAFTSNCEIGIDIEQIRPLSEMQDLANQLFSAEEASELMSLPDSQREPAFYLGWTRKEAYLKAIGEGLSRPLNSFRIEFDSEHFGRPIPFGVEMPALELWTIVDLTISPGFAGSLAYSDAKRPVRVTYVADPAAL
jgi:4'-phosphopantetheinyl transferase